MMKNPVLIFALISLLFIVSTRCSREDLPNTHQNEAFIYDKSNNFVSLSLVKKYASNKIPVTKSCVPDIKAVTGVSGDTLMYVVNYGSDKGWEVLSADSRTPAVIAVGYSGSFDIQDGNPALQEWMECTKEDMQFVVRASDKELNFSDDDIAAHKQFWNGNQPRIKLPDEDDPGGGSWYTTVTTTTEVVDSLNHLTVTQWDQGTPYNAYCPFKNGSTTDRVPAGCVAIAGAQLLYFLHYKIGVPAMMVSQGICVGQVGNIGNFGNNYYQHFYDYSATVWDEMETDSKGLSSPVGPESVMIGFVGFLLHIDYGNSSSSAYEGDLVEAVFNYLGIDCDFDEYNSSIVKNCLLSGYPVISAAMSAWLFGTGHAFIIDGYKSMRTITTEYHYWMSNSGEPGMDPLHEPYTIIRYSDPTIQYFKMNWGWWSQWNEDKKDDGWYAPTGDWYTQSTGHSYNYYRTMIYNFSVL